MSSDPLPASPEAPSSPPRWAGWIGVGSNLGDRLFFCREAVGALRQIGGLSVTGLSSLYETAPMDYAAQPPFYNAVVQIEAGLLPHNLLARCQEIERHLGRVRLVPKGPRTLDLDLLCYGAWIVGDATLTLPHPAMALRPFVLVPLGEIAPHFAHPVTGLSPQQMLDRLDVADVKKVSEPDWAGWRIDTGQMQGTPRPSGTPLPDHGTGTR